MSDQTTPAEPALTEAELESLRDPRVLLDYPMLLRLLAEHAAMRKAVRAAEVYATTEGETTDNWRKLTAALAALPAGLLDQQEKPHA